MQSRWEILSREGWISLGGFEQRDPGVRKWRVFTGSNCHDGKGNPTWLRHGVKMESVWI